MPWIFRLAMAIDFVVLFLNHNFPILHKVWPFSMEHFDCSATLLLAAAICSEVAEVISKLRPPRD
ncbi:hypothetical protein MMA231_03581 (plasmid) [Asticcacaulis sp. MM231]